MDIKEVKIAKEKVEKSILNLLNAFSDSTGVTIGDLDIDYYPAYDGTNIIRGVKLTITL